MRKNTPPKYSSMGRKLCHLDRHTKAAAKRRSECGLHGGLEGSWRLGLVPSSSPGSGRTMETGEAGNKPSPLAKGNMYI